MKQYIKTQLKEVFTKEQIEHTIIRDLTDMTDDPGNTILVVALVPGEHYVYENQDLDKHEEIFHEPHHVLEISSELNNLFDSGGDHVEEVIVTLMNNEYCILFNFNK